MITFFLLTVIVRRRVQNGSEFTLFTLILFFKGPFYSFHSPIPEENIGTKQ